MRILVASAWDPTSGVATVYRLLARRLASRGVRYSAFAFDGWGPETWWTFCDELIDGRSTTLAEALMSGRYDVLHCIAAAYSPPYGVETWVRRARFRGPVVLMSQLAQRELTEPAHATRYVACSADSARELAHEADGDVIVIPNGFDEEVFRPASATAGSRPLLVWVGRSSDPQKDVGLFLDGVEALPDYDAVVVDATSSAPEAVAVHERVLALAPRATHLGLQAPEEVAALYRTAAASGGAYVCTSRYEGFIISASEALACGCPVVASRVPGTSHLADGVNAVTFDRSGGTAALIEAVRRLDDPVFRSRIVAQGLSDVRGWASGPMAERYLRVYEEALAATDGPAFVQRVTDSVVRQTWRAGLRFRPLWHRALDGARRVRRPV